MNKLAEIQKSLKVPKNQYNSFSNFNYRSLEDILEALKPLLGEATLRIHDEIVQIGERFYVKATAILKDGEETWENVAYAREAESKKGMDESQITGATSSYARKYCLNGLFLIDDTKDADTMNNSASEGGSTNKEKKPAKTQNIAPQSTSTKKSGTYCTICGKEGRVSPISGKHYCDDWKEHDAMNQKYEMVSKPKSDFIQSLDDDIPVIQQ